MDRSDLVTSGSQSMNQSGVPSEKSQPVFPYVGVCCLVFSYDILQDDNSVIIEVT